MLLAAYIPYQKDEPREEIKLLTNHLNYEPIFCFKADNARSALINSILSSPEKPEKIVFFETNEYVEIDTVQWNRFRWELTNKQDEMTMTIADCFTTMPDVYKEFLVKEIDNPIVEIDLKKALFVNAEIEGSEWRSFLADVIASSQTCALNICKAAHPIVAIDVPWEAYDKIAHLLIKEGFQYFMLPLLYPLALDRPVSYSTYFNYNEYMKRMTLNKIARMSNTEEDLSEKTYKKFEEILVDLRSCMTKTYDRVLSDGFNGTDTELGPNIMCPCGSGKKYKKCCRGSFLENL